MCANRVKSPAGNHPATRHPGRFLVILTLLLASQAAAQWNTQSPLPTNLDIRGVGAPTAGRVFIATADNSFDTGGALFESADGGATWVQRNVPFSLFDPLNGLFFLDSLHGWAFGNANYRTTDGGTTWTELPFLGSTYFMEFYSADFGVTTGNFGAYVSGDGGLTWTPSPNNIRDFDFADDLTGLGVSATGIYRTTDGGATFSPVHAGDATAAAFLSASVAVGIVDGVFVRSTDGGITWTVGVTADGRSRLVAVTADVALAWGRAGAYPDYDDRIFRSSDAGQTWTDLGEVIDPGAFANTFAFSVPTASTVVASDGAGSVYHSPDAGLTWSLAFASPGFGPGFLGSAVPAFADGSTGYFGYGPGFVIKTVDGGVSWSQISSGSGESIIDMDRFANGSLIAVGENGTVLTSTGTSPWVLSTQFTTSHVQAVQVIGPQEVVVVDETARVYRSTDGGATWTAAAAVPLGLEARDLHFTTSLDGWVTGFGLGDAALYHTTDGGITWTPALDAQGAYVAVDIEGESGWAANVSGRYYRTIDGGDTWIQGDLPGSSVLVNDMDFFDVSIGYAVGWWGYAVRSDDGGMTWETLPVPIGSDQITDIYLLGPNELWISTNAGAAYYTATGGQTWALMDIGSAGFGNFATIAASPAGDAWTAGFQGYIEHFTGPPPPPLNRPPESSFDFVTTGLSVDLTDTSTDPDGIIVSWAWDFGDSATSTEQNPTHLFASASTYIVTLVVTDDDGDTGGSVRFIAVQPGPGGTFGAFTEVTPLDPLFVTPQDEDFWVVTTAPADYDGDGDLDIAVFGFYVVYNTSVEHRLVLFRNDGPAVAPDEWEFAYIDLDLGALYAGESDLAWGDVDGDGDLDLAVGTSGQTVIYRNDAGTLVLSDTVLPGYYEDNFQADFDLRSLSWADFDNDGDFDLLIPSVFDFETFLYRTAMMRNDGPNGTGGSVFTEVDAGFAPTIHAQSEWADYDGDQDMDLLLIHLSPLTDDGFIRRYRNDGEGTFTGEDILGTLTINHGEAHWGDYDADGDLDILVVGHIRETDGTSSKVLRIYRNDAETYVPIEVIACPACDGWFDLTAATWADYDSDGDMDIMVTGNYNSGSQIDGRARVFVNEGGVFMDSGSELPAPRASGSRGGTFSWLDLDGDADLDYFIAGQYFVPGGNGLVEAQMHAYRNDSPAQNIAPSTPSNVAAIVDGGTGTVSISWNAAIDDFTPAAALTYDLDLYQGGIPVTSPRRLPEPGSISAVTDWVLAGLPDGKYTWKLRAVDSAFNGGTAATGSFTLGVSTGVETAGTLPRTFALEQNFPNPFNPTTTLRFALPERAAVHLDVYNLGGQRVTRLVNSTLPPGVHDIRWDAGDLASGTYFVRLSTDRFTETRRVMLVK